MNRVFYVVLAATVILNACHSRTTTAVKALVFDGDRISHHIGYDDSTLHNTAAPFVMPYNRIIQPAGTVVYVGDTKYENHSLDCKLIPGQNFLAEEDRYGIAVIDTKNSLLTDRWTYNEVTKYLGCMSTYSGIQVITRYGKTRIFWSAANPSTHLSYVMMAEWDGEHIFFKKAIAIKAEGDSPLALPNEIADVEENNEEYLYVVLNGNNQLMKIRLRDSQVVWNKPTGVAPYGLTVIGSKAYVTNWGGTEPTDTINEETAGVPYGHVYTAHSTGATSQGTVSVINTQTGALIKEIRVGLHPNAIVASPDKHFIYVANGNSDNISVIDVAKLGVIDSINVKLDAGHSPFIGDSPNGLATSPMGTMLYVSNGMDNAVAVIKLGQNVASNGKDTTFIEGFIPTEAYPAGLTADENNLYVCNLEGEGARVSSDRMTDPNSNIVKRLPGVPPVEAYNSHHQEATVSVIPLPEGALQLTYSTKVNTLNLLFREDLARLLPRKNVEPIPIPQRVGEPSVFKHVVYIIKENRTYDQILGDLPCGNGDKTLCIYGDTVTPNQHQLARDFEILDNYYASGKSSAEGHQWTDAAMVNDYVEKNVRAWFRSYPHTQTDALVYGKFGFIWNNALDHGKSVRIYGETATPIFDPKLNWTDIYNLYRNGKPFDFKNYTTIARVRPVLAADYPGYDTHVINDQIRADAFIKELKEYENEPGDQWPQLMVLALPADHTGGMRPDLPTPRAMVADNDLALGRIIEAITHSRFYDSTVVFVTEDDSQDGWDHVSAYRTTGFVISPYSHLQREIHTNYNQTCIVRTIEQILGLPPMNIIDATAMPMFDVFTGKPDTFAYTHKPNIVQLDEMNKPFSMLKGTALYYAKAAMQPQYNHIDGGNDDLLNKMLWFAAKGKSSYPQSKDKKTAVKDDD